MRRSHQDAEKLRLALQTSVPTDVRVDPAGIAPARHRPGTAAIFPSPYWPSAIAAAGTGCCASAAAKWNAKVRCGVVSWQVGIRRSVSGRCAAGSGQSRPEQDPGWGPSRRSGPATYVGLRPFSSSPMTCSRGRAVSISDAPPGKRPAWLRFAVAPCPRFPVSVSCAVPAVSLAGCPYLAGPLFFSACGVRVARLNQ
jgi:hypothetical protein